MKGPCYKRETIKLKPKVKYSYKSKDKIITDEKILTQLNNIKIPPTYSKVVICPNHSNDLIATGYDSTDRKQYFYSQKHQIESSKNKYCNLIQLGKLLPKITKDINNLINRANYDNIDQNILDALALRVMMLCNFRVGNNHNVKEYNTYGLTTLTNNHIKIGGNRNNNNDSVHIKFNGKKQQINECIIRDKKTVNFLKLLTKHRSKLDKNSKETLFSFNNIKVTPESLNKFLSKYDPNITTKVWRTWFANISYLTKILKQDISDTKTHRKQLNNKVIKQISEELHHTPAINKRNYLINDLPKIYIENPLLWNKMKNKNEIPATFLINFLINYCKK